MVNLVAILFPALLGVAAAFAVRGALRRLGWLAWLGWTLLGAGAPVLLGQLAALFVVDQAEGGVVSAGGAALVQTALAAGLAGGLGWAAGALSMRFTGGPPPDPD
ncbi:MAG: hypothetical protein ACLFQ5_11205 [Oceanicaulis sp.]